MTQSIPWTTGIYSAWNVISHWLTPRHCKHWCKLTRVNWINEWRVWTLKIGSKTRFGSGAFAFMTELNIIKRQVETKPKLWKRKWFGSFAFSIKHKSLFSWRWCRAETERFFGMIAWNKFGNRVTTKRFFFH